MKTNAQKLRRINSNSKVIYNIIKKANVDTKLTASSIADLSKLTLGETEHSLQELEKNKLVEYDRGEYDLY